MGSLFCLYKGQRYSLYLGLYLRLFYLYIEKNELEHVQIVNNFIFTIKGVSRQATIFFVSDINSYVGTQMVMKTLLLIRNS